ncbi:syntaxin-125-like [Hibiscus syriacus]|uniref:syntaxin-125-like n=1 Tax=Hibiscus syriacus TaxID=106335 RepID=UPI001921CF9E|nr:syntaxin-125-like [Hibiscus syriacus]
MDLKQQAYMDNQEAITETVNLDKFFEDVENVKEDLKTMETLYKLRVNISEIQERHDAVKEIEKNLLKLHQIFLDMAALVKAQGHQLNDIKSNVSHACSFVRPGTEQLQEAREQQKSSRKWTCYAIIAAIILIIVILLPLLPTIITLLKHK